MLQNSLEAPNCGGKTSSGYRRPHFSRSPLEAPGVFMSLQTAKTAIARATGGAGVGAGEAAHCTKSPGGNVGLWQLYCQVGHLSILLPCFLFQQLCKVLSKPLLVVFHCARLSFGFPRTMFLLLLEQTQGFLAHNKVGIGIVAVVVLFQVFQCFSGPALPGGIIKDPSLSCLLNP